MKTPINVANLPIKRLSDRVFLIGFSSKEVLKITDVLAFRENGVQALATFLSLFEDEVNSIVPTFGNASFGGSESPHIQQIGYIVVFTSSVPL